MKGMNGITMAAIYLTAEKFDFRRKFLVRAKFMDKEAHTAA